MRQVGGCIEGTPLCTLRPSLYGGGGVGQDVLMIVDEIQGYLAHKKPPPPSTTIGP